MSKELKTFAETILKHLTEKQMKTSIDITYQDITMEVTGDYYAGCASTSRDVPNDNPTFTIDTVTVGGVDICNLLDLEIIEEITLETLKA